MPSGREAWLVGAIGVAVGLALPAVVRAVVERVRGLVNHPAAWASRSAHDVAGGLYAFYSSLAGAITTDPRLMAVPIDDHSIVRGHAVFDTATFKNGRLYRLDIHLDRLFASAAAARLRLPFGADEAHNRREITRIAMEACRASGRREADVRFWLTAGTGNLGVTPSGCQPQFYVSARDRGRAPAPPGVLRRRRPSLLASPEPRAPPAPTTRSSSSSEASPSTPRGTPTESPR
jgi:hypothetical protein